MRGKEWAEVVGTIRRRKTSLGPLGMKIQEGEQPALEGSVCRSFRRWFLGDWRS